MIGHYASDFSGVSVFGRPAKAASAGGLRVEQTLRPIDRAALLSALDASFAPMKYVVKAKLVLDGIQQRDDGAFEVNDLLPGSYQIRVRSNSGSPYEHPVAIQVGNAGVTGLVIRPVRRQGPR